MANPRMAQQEQTTPDGQLQVVAGDVNSNWNIVGLPLQDEGRCPELQDQSLGLETLGNPRLCTPIGPWYIRQGMGFHRKIN